MSATWDDKLLKDDPIGDDEFLIIDTADSRNQKRTKLSSFSDWSRNIAQNFIFPFVPTDKVVIGTNTVQSSQLHVQGTAKITSTLDMSTQLINNVLNPPLTFLISLLETYKCLDGLLKNFNSSNAESPLLLYAIPISKYVNSLFFVCLFFFST